MKSFTYKIADPVGIHARPAGILVKELKSCEGVSVTISKDDRSVDALKLMSLIDLGVKQGDTVTVSVEGRNEDEVAAKIEEFFKTYF